MIVVEVNLLDGGDATSLTPPSWGERGTGGGMAHTHMQIVHVHINPYTCAHTFKHTANLGIPSSSTSSLTSQSFWPDMMSHHNISDTEKIRSVLFKPSLIYQTCYYDCSEQFTSPLHSLFHSPCFLLLLVLEIIIRSLPTGENTFFVPQK